MSKLTVFAAVLAAVALAGSSAVAQAPAQAASKQQSQSPKKPKVWTDDNISSVRSSSDIYQDEQERYKAAQQVSASQQSATAAKNGADDAWPIPQAKTAKEADDLLARDKQTLQEQQEYIQQTQKELATATTDSYKKRLQWRLQSRSDMVGRLQRDISSLEKQKDALAKQAQPGGASNPAAQPPSQ